MDDIEKRLAALEMAFIEIGAWMDPAALEDAARSVRAGLDGCSDDERAVRLHVLDLIKDALERFGRLSG